MYNTVFKKREKKKKKRKRKTKINQPLPLPGTNSKVKSIAFSKFSLCIPQLFITYPHMQKLAIKPALYVHVYMYVCVTRATFVTPDNNK